jgi:hypothetical protein
MNERENRNRLRMELSDGELQRCIDALKVAIGVELPADARLELEILLGALLAEKILRPKAAT